MELRRNLNLFKTNLQITTPSFDKTYLYNLASNCKTFPIAGQRKKPFTQMKDNKLPASPRYPCSDKLPASSQRYPDNKLPASPRYPCSDKSPASSQRYPDNKLPASQRYPCSGSLFSSPAFHHYDCDKYGGRSEIL